MGNTMIKHQVDSCSIDEMTLDMLQAFIDEARGIGFPGDAKIRVIGRNEGYTFTGTYRFSPTAVRVGYRDDD